MHTPKLPEPQHLSENHPLGTSPDQLGFPGEEAVAMPSSVGPSTGSPSQGLPGP